MEMNRYQDLASRTAPKDLEFNLLVSNLCMGLAGEAGEVVDYLKKVIYHGHEYDPEKLVSELGDLEWYISQLAAAFGETLGFIAEYNIDKLKRRYPEGFKESDSINREEYHVPESSK